MDYPHIDHQTILDLFDYNKNSGAFKWTNNASNRVRRKIAGTVRSSINSHISVVCINGKYYHKSILIWFYVTGEWLDKSEIDFKDNNSLNFSWNNLIRSLQKSRRIDAITLHDMLGYDKNTGDFTWINCSNPAMNNKKAGTDISRRGKTHRKISISGNSYTAKRLAYFYMTGTWNMSRKLTCIDGDDYNTKWNNIELVD